MNDDSNKRQQSALVRRLRKAEKFLSQSDECEGANLLGAWIAQSGRCQLQVAWDRSLFEALVRAIAHQQLHGRAAESILGRLIESFAKSGNTFPTPRQLSRAAPERLRACGFSTAKVVAIQGIAAATASGQVPERTEAELLSDTELIDRLLPLRGVGKWTVEMLLIFTLGRLDVMPVDDFGIRSGLKHLHGLAEHPKRRDFVALTDHWQPYRTIGAWYLWRLADARKCPAS